MKMLSITTENLQGLGRTEIPSTVHISIQGQAGLLACFPVGAGRLLEEKPESIPPFLEMCGESPGCSLSDSAAA